MTPLDERIAELERLASEILRCREENRRLGFGTVVKQNRDFLILNAPVLANNALQIISELKEERDSAATTASNALDEIRRLVDVITAQRTEIEQLKGEVEKAREQRDQVWADKKKYREGQFVAEAKLKTLEQENARLREALNEAIGKLAHPTSCLKLLPTEQWTDENGNYTLECTCVLDKLKAALTGKAEESTSG